MLFRAQVALLVITASASAQPKITLGPATPGTCDVLVPVMAQATRCAAVSDVHGVLAFGHDKIHPSAHVTLVKLDANGTPAAYTMPITLPKPVGLVKNKNYVTGVAFHPKLPRLYVWQDIDVYYTNPPPPAPPETMQFDHLCIYDIGKEAPELLVSLCRGQEFIYGQGGGSVAIDPTGSFLYIPNVREISNAGSFRLGRFPLDAEGVPLAGDAKGAKKLGELNVAGKVRPPTLTPVEYVNLFGNSVWGCGHSIVPLSKEVLLASVQQGLLAWQPENATVTVHAMPLRNAGHTQFVVHPALPAIFATAYDGQHPDALFRAEHADGYLTLLPRQYILTGSKLMSPPAILSKQKKVAVGGQHLVYVLDLDDKAFPIGAPIAVQVNCPQVHGLVYSERFGRLYVGVEVSK